MDQYREEYDNVQLQDNLPRGEDSLIIPRTRFKWIVLLCSTNPPCLPGHIFPRAMRLPSGNGHYRRTLYWPNTVMGAIVYDLNEQTLGGQSKNATHSAGQHKML